MDDRLPEHLHRIASPIVSALRLEIVRALSHQPSDAPKLSRRLGVEPAAVSHAIERLVEYGIVVSDAATRPKQYKLAPTASWSESPAGLLIKLRTNHDIEITIRRDTKNHPARAPE